MQGCFGERFFTAALTLAGFIVCASMIRVHMSHHPPALNQEKKADVVLPLLVRLSQFYQSTTTIKQQ